MATKARLGKPLPDIPVQATGDARLRLADLAGRRLVLYFYPKDNTPGCTAEGIEFRDQYAAFKKLKAAVYGVSRDSLASHERFKAKYELPFELIADVDERLCRAFDVIKTKTLYGRRYRGIERSTFLFDADGVLRKEFRAVKVKGHAKEVLGELKNL